MKILIENIVTVLLSVFFIRTVPITTTLNEVIVMNHNRPFNHKVLFTLNMYLFLHLFYTSGVPATSYNRILITKKLPLHPLGFEYRELIYVNRQVFNSLTRLRRS